jgi:hypothetical protein
MLVPVSCRVSTIPANTRFGIIEPRATFLGLFLPELPPAGLTPRVSSSADGNQRIAGPGQAANAAANREPGETNMTTVTKTINTTLAGLALIAGLAIGTAASAGAASNVVGAGAALAPAPAAKLQTLETTGSEASLILVGRGGRSSGFGRGFGGGRHFGRGFGGGRHFDRGFGGGRHFGRGGKQFGRPGCRAIGCRPHRPQTKRSYGYAVPVGTLWERRETDPVRLCDMWQRRCNLGNRNACDKLEFYRCYGN